MAIKTFKDIYCKKFIQLYTGSGIHYRTPETVCLLQIDCTNYNYPFYLPSNSYLRKNALFYFTFSEYLLIFSHKCQMRLLFLDNHILY